MGTAQDSTDSQLQRFESEVLAVHPDFAVLCRLEPQEQELLVVYVNPAGEAILGRPASTIVGQTVRSLMADPGSFTEKSQRLAFFAQLRAHGTLEFPGAMATLDVNGSRRELRVRVIWPPPGDRVLFVGEDVTERTSLDEHNSARARLRSAMDVSALFSHHINNALASALLNVELTASELEDKLAPEISEDVQEQLRAVTNSIRTAAQVVGALAATTTTELGVERTADLLVTLQAALDAVQGGSGRRPQLEAPEGPCWVWGSAEQLHMILMGFLPLLRAEAQDALSLHVECTPSEGVVRLSIFAVGSGDAWLRPLLDPSGAHVIGGSGPVRLFASTQVLHAIGGRLGLPRLGKRALGIELTFRAASGPVALGTHRASYLLVSGDAALRAMVANELAGRHLEFTESVREGVVRTMRPNGGFVIYDVDRIDIPADELLSFCRAVDVDSHRFALVGRDGTRLPRSDVATLTVPFSASDLDAALSP